MKRVGQSFLCICVFGFATLSCSLEPVEQPSLQETPGNEAISKPMGVCPPFFLRDEKGNIINPVKGINASVPYSPKQTCGASGCHDYSKITKGFHFQQGANEEVPPEMQERYTWVSHPGNYGGNWCSPAPLYRQLAPKKNASARTIDMTSFDFVTATCGNCHPGGGPLEYDREGKRYDEWMKDPASGLVPGGENGLDGDYYKALWSETGVLEADCLLCHDPNYDYDGRNKALQALNFRWAATVGARLGTVTGAVKQGEKPIVTYDLSRFNDDGTVKVHIAPEPRNQTCLKCHAKPQWKKRGAAFSARTDVHIAAGLRCTDCHTAGSKASDPRIRGKEEHQIGKGDDPSGWVRNDLDGTVRDCSDCHIKGYGKAPIARHSWLPPLHLEKISCEACHIPVRTVKSALVQASDVYNDAPRITPPPKRIWVFYDQNMQFWNHYGELDLFTVADQPTDVFRPTLFRYKGKIYPGNRVHTSFVGIQVEGKQGLDQLFMKDFYDMWVKHRQDPAKAYPELAKIKDDNGDGVPEVSTKEEIDALLSATTKYLKDTNYPMEGKTLVWVSDDRACRSSSDCFDLPKKDFEASPYASVYKYSHDVAPAKAALGAGGCTDCHRMNSPFFQRAVLRHPFDSPKWIANAEILGVSPTFVVLGAFREGILKPLIYTLLAVFLILLACLGLKILLCRTGLSKTNARNLALLLLPLLAIIFVAIAYSSDLLEYVVGRRFVLDSNHFWVSVLVLCLTLFIAIDSSHPFLKRMSLFLWSCVGFVGLCGLLMTTKVVPDVLLRLSYTGFDLGVCILAILATIASFVRLIRDDGSKAGRANA